MPTVRRAFLASSGAAVLLGAALRPGEAAPRSVAITAIVEHPALDACRDGIVAELAARKLDVATSYESAQGNPATAAQIARKLVGAAPAVIVPISTPSAQAVVAATRSIPVVFTAVSDPLGAKLVKSLARPGGNVTGMSDLSPIGRQLDLVRALVPDARRLGVIYNPGEANAVTLVGIVEATAPGLGLTVRKAAAPQSSAVQAAARSLVGAVDAIYLPTDNTVITALEAVLRVGTENRLPVFAGDTDSVARGAVAAVGFDYRDVGTQTGRIVARVLAGESPGDIPVEGVAITRLFVNRASAAAMGVTLPDAVLREAATVL